MTAEITDKFKLIIDMLKNNQSFIFWLNNNERNLFSCIIKEVNEQLRNFKLLTALEQKRKEENESKFNQLNQHRQNYFNDMSEHNSSFENDSNHCYSLFDSQIHPQKIEEENKQFLEDDEISFFSDTYIKYLQDQIGADVEMADVSSDVNNHPAEVEIQNSQPIILNSSDRRDVWVNQLKETESSNLQISNQKYFSSNKESQIFSKTEEKTTEFDKLLAESNQKSTFRLAQNPLMTQDERIWFYKSISTQNEYSQIENPILIYDDHDGDEIKFLTQTQMEEWDPKRSCTSKDLKNIEESNKAIRDAKNVQPNDGLKFNYQIEKSTLPDGNDKWNSSKYKISLTNENPYILIKSNNIDSQITENLNAISKNRLKINLSNATNPFRENLNCSDKAPICEDSFRFKVQPYESAYIAESQYNYHPIVSNYYSPSAYSLERFESARKEQSNQNIIINLWEE